MASGPLHGIRVLDLTNVLAGPYCAYQLALLGADTIKVETPRTGDLARTLGADPALNRKQMGASFLAQNAGKRSIALNLKHAAGRIVLEKLAERADVLVENFRPGVMTRLGLGPERLLARNPRLVYCAISGFGQQGPLAGNPAYDQIVQGMSGAMSVTGTRDTAPLRAGYPVADTIAGTTAAFAICAALVSRGRTGKGQIVDVSMLDSMLGALGWAVSNFLICGVPPMAMGNDNVTASPSGTFRTATEPLNVAANKQDQFEALCRLIGRADLIADPRFADRDTRIAHRAALAQAIEAGLMTRSAADWEVALNAAGVPAGRVLDVPQTLALPQIAERALVRSFDHVAGADQPVAVLRAGFRMSDGEIDPRLPPPRLDEHGDAILRELGYDDATIARLREDGAR
jgi:CoA:oxalate CoA-transferase